MSDNNLGLKIALLRMSMDKLIYTGMPVFLSHANTKPHWRKNEIH